MINNIKYQLFIKEIKQVEIAREAGVSKSFISSVISGREKPSIKVKEAFKKLADITLEVTNK